jgi:hypothetical protein
MNCSRHAHAGSLSPGHSGSNRPAGRETVERSFFVVRGGLWPSGMRAFPHGDGHDQDDYPHHDVSGFVRHVVLGVMLPGVSKFGSLPKRRQAPGLSSSAPVKLQDEPHFLASVPHIVAGFPMVPVPQVRGDTADKHPTRCPTSCCRLQPEWNEACGWVLRWSGIWEPPVVASAELSASGSISMLGNGWRVIR